MSTTAVNANLGTSSSGTVQTNGNTTYITGISTGLDTEALITAGYNQKLQPYNAVETEITTNTNTISGYSTLQSDSQSLLNAFDSLQSVTQNPANTNAFSSKSISYAASDSSSGSNIVTASVSSGASAGTHQVIVKALAQPLSVTSDAQTSATTALGYNGTFTIGETGKTAATITVSATSTLTDIENAINATTTTSGVKADLLQVAGGGYKLVLTGNDSNTSFTATAASGDDVLQDLGVNNSSGSFKNVSETAQPADFILDGTEITSNTNTLNNVLTGLNLQLVNAAPNTTVTITLGNDTTSVTNAINSFVSAYNTLRSSLDQLQQVNSDGTVATGAYLANDSLTREFEQQLEDALTQTYYGSTSISGLGALGITLDANNQLEVNSTTLSNALNDNFSQVQAFFQTTNGNTGLADNVYSVVNYYANTSTGQFQSESATLTNDNTNLSSQATEYLDTANDYKTYLINKYATLESSVSQSQITISQVKAILAGSSDSSS